MAYQLVAEVLNHAPADLTPAQRLMLVVLAESADLQTRECYPGRDALRQRTGLSERSVRRVLDELAERGLDVRVATGLGGDGRPVYAVGGRRTVYRLPVMRRTPTTPSTPKEADADDPLRRTLATDEADAGDRTGGRWRPPFRHEPSGNRHVSSRAHETDPAAVRTALETATGRKITDEHAHAVIRDVLSRNGGATIANPTAYIVKAITTEPGRYAPASHPPRLCVACQRREAVGRTNRCGDTACASS